MLSLWFPKLASDQALRHRSCDAPFALNLRVGNADHLHCLNRQAEAAGLRRGMGLADARALCPGLVTRPADLVREAAGLAALLRWAGRYSPMVGHEGSDGLVADLTGVAHLWDGEAALLADLAGRLARAGITARAAVADTRGAAYALARHGEGPLAPPSDCGVIAPPGQGLAALADLPPVALRLDHETATALARLGLRRIADLVTQPRAPLARRFGPGLLLRLDQALGAMAEPVSPAAATPYFAVRMTLPEPIGLIADVEAGLARLLDQICGKLLAAYCGARWLRLELQRVDRGDVAVEVGLARPMRDARRIAALFRPALEGVDAGFGIDRLRLVVTVVEPMPPEQLGNVVQAGKDAFDDLVTRLGNRLGFDRITRFLPADSHIPEQSYNLAPVAYSQAVNDWPSGPDRPLQIFPPEPLMVQGAQLPQQFRWRRMSLTIARATGPERIEPEWWLDTPAWRSGLRDYWKVETTQGRRLWLFYTPRNPGWFVQGEFA